ncbi:MAG: hypothetical protein KF870_03940 [Leadbetterella sp.]|nr:hypothetical protein [Leadbetterella sp.]
MFVDFKTLPENARVWVYQADRHLSEAEQARVLDFLSPAVESWVTHGMPMRGSVQVLFNRLVLIAADIDFQHPSGCSIDSSTRWLQELGAAMNISFFDRSIGYFEDGEWKFFSVFDARKQVSGGIIRPDTRVINPRVETVGDLENALVLPASASFLSRYFSTVESR